MDPYLIVDTLSAFFAQSVLDIVIQLFAIFGWIVFVFMLLYVFSLFWVDFREDKHTANWKYTLLAIDIPQLNVQTPKAVEQMFSHLAGALQKPEIKEKFWTGFKQRWFSMEIISIEGYIQFLIWTEDEFRDLVEASMYAQYPDAEITEVEDYVDMIPDKYPNDTHDIWIGDFGLEENNAYPIRSYREFEHSIAKDTVLKDPMGTFLESFTRIGSGEQMWFQIIVQPIGNKWKEDVIDKIKDVIGEKKKAGETIGDIVTKLPLMALEGLGDAAFAREGSVLDKKEESSDDGEKNLLKYLTPGQTKIVEGMEEKIMKIGFKTKMRGLYAARKEIYNPRRGVNALVGAMNQYNIPTANSIIPTVKASKNTKSDNRKKNKLLKAYRKRKQKTGGNPFILNVEELATVWHFPMSHVKTPLVQKAAVKTAEPPIGLPMESLFGTMPDVELVEEEEEEQKGKQIVTDSGEVIEFGELG